MKLSFVARKVGGKLVPVDLHGDEELARAKEGTEFYIEAQNFVPPTLKQLRTAWALADILYQNDPHSRFYDKDDTMGYLQTMCRIADIRISAVTGSMMVTRKSLNDLGKDGLSRLIDCSLKLVQDELGISHPELVRELMERLGSA